ncbi:metal-dependent hydrolase [Actinomadura barringtoniae]|uniref:Metal-dependent hydrolase n=1 Tax=Actinomadura barringtoniae TaxID=1427535 RepID=A0A939T5B6_9ACTN|nr:metal-dependent hydrolase [Actinomadura barringtoniae]MBO2449319.1 metal-dependent hydrolase [Actinomadura barringtoniae]
MTFPAGAVSGRSEVLAAIGLDGGGFGVVTRETPFHPLDHTWPDQPADTGLIVVDEVRHRVVDCLTGAMEEAGSGALLLGTEIPVRRGDEGWDWLVVHVVEREVAVGEPADLEVDPDRRRALSAGHTACHLMALALNAALAPRWRKEARNDGLGRPDFDSLAITSSRIVEGGSLDTYRLGKSLRKKGFTAEGLADDLPALTEEINGLLAEWLASDAPVRIEVPSPELTARREWHCSLPDGEVSIPCGGTHVRRLGELSSATATLELSPEGDELAVETKAVFAGR